MKAEIVLEKVSADNRFRILIERQSAGIYDNCFEVYLYDRDQKQGHSAFSTFPEALDFMYQTIENHAKEGVVYNQ